jgi:hypothetical protein
MNSPFVPMTLGDIFEKTFIIFGRTFVRNLIIASLFLIIPIVMMAVAADVFYSSIGELQESLLHGQSETGLDALMPLAGAVSFFAFATIVLVICVLFAEIAISIVVSQEMLSRPISYGDAIDETFHQKWLFGIGQGLLKYLILIGSVVLVGITTAILAAISKFLMGLVLVLCILILLPVVLYLAFKWYFSLTAVAVDDLGVTDSMRKSWQLVGGFWWRTFGIILLLSTLTQFVITIISLPITFASMWDVYKNMFTVIGKTGGNISPEIFQEIQKSIGPGVGISTGISSLLSLLITPVFTVVLYYDLRARNNDFPHRKESAVLNDQPQQPIDLGPM